MQEAVIISKIGFHAYEIGDIVEIIGECPWFSGGYIVKGRNQDVCRMVKQIIRPCELAFLMSYNPS